MTKLILLSFLLCHNVFALVKKGVEFSDTLTVADKNLILNGVGLRSKTIFRVKVYWGALYLQKKSSDYNDILKTSPVKHVIMHFLRDIDAQKLRDGWAESFKRSGHDPNQFQKEWMALINATQDVKKGDRYELTFQKGKLSLTMSGKKHPDIVHPKFADALFSIWFVNQEDEDLRDGMLAR